MKRAVLAIALAIGFLVDGAVAQFLLDDQAAIAPRSIQLTDEQDHVIKEIVIREIVLEGLPVEQVPPTAEIDVGDKVPIEVELLTFSPYLTEWVPQVSPYKFFVTWN